VTLFLAIFFVFWVFWRPQEWLFPWMFGWPILDLVVGTAVIALVMELGQGAIKMPRALPQPYLLLGLFVSAILSHVVHTYLGGILFTVPDVFKFCFFCFLLICVIRKPSHLRIISWVVVAMACVMATHALLQERYFAGFMGAAPLYIPAGHGHGDFTRSLFFGIFGDPNDLAQMLAAALPFSFVLFRKRGIRSAVTGLCVSTFLIAAIQSTHSRGGIVGLVVALGIMGILLLPARWMPALLGGVVLGGLLVIPFTSGWLDDSTRDRVVFWGYANQYFKDNLLFGIGYRMFWMVADDRAAHNAFVLCYTELGLVGYWFWFGLVFTAVMGAWRTRVLLVGEESAEGKWVRRYAGYGIASMAGFMASAYFLSRAFVFPLFFLVAMLAVIPKLAEDILPSEAGPIMSRGINAYVLNTAASMLSVVYIYVSILALNKVFAGG
jgi:hypothetical protein